MRIIEALAMESCPAVFGDNYISNDVWQFSCGLTVSAGLGDTECDSEGISESLTKVHLHHHAHLPNDRGWWEFIEEVIENIYDSEWGYMRNVILNCDCPEATERQMFQQTFDLDEVDSGVIVNDTATL